MSQHQLSRPDQHGTEATRTSAVKVTTSAARDGDLGEDTVEPCWLAPDLVLSGTTMTGTVAGR